MGSAANREQQESWLWQLFTRIRHSWCRRLRPWAFLPPCTAPSNITRKLRRAARGTTKSTLLKHLMCSQRSGSPAQTLVHRECNNCKIPYRKFQLKSRISVKIYFHIIFFSYSTLLTYFHQ